MHPMDYPENRKHDGNVIPAQFSGFSSFLVHILVFWDENS